jgi:hypothetical protein
VENLRTILRATLRVKHLYMAGLGLTDQGHWHAERGRASSPRCRSRRSTCRAIRSARAAPRALIEGFEACHTLHTLTLQMCSITDKQLSRWDALFTTPPLLHLDVSHNKLGDDGVRHLMALAAKRQRLLTLDVGVTGGRPSTAEVMAKWLNHNQQLLVLRVRGHRLRRLWPAARQGARQAPLAAGARCDALQSEQAAALRDSRRRRVRRCAATASCRRI